LPVSETARASRLAVEIWSTYAQVRLAVHRRPLPELVEELREASDRLGEEFAPEELSAAVDRRLSVGRRRPTCLASALVLFRLLRRRGREAELVIGLPEDPSTHEAHAWVELDGRDVGPPPGRNGHVELARFG
jgi:hypothetical protein